MDPLRASLAFLGTIVFGGFLAATVHVYAQDSQNVAIVPLAILSAAGLGVVLAAFTPLQRR